MLAIVLVASLLILGSSVEICVRARLAILTMDRPLVSTVTTRAPQELVLTTGQQDAVHAILQDTDISSVIFSAVA